MKPNYESYSGRYKGITWEITRGFLTPNQYDQRDERWCFYIYLGIEQMPIQSQADFWLPVASRDDKNRVHYNEYRSEHLNSLPWHGGLTWYSKEGGHDETNRTIKAGCDYSHLWDEGRTFTADGILYEVKEVINSFLDSMLEYKVWCSGNGNFYHPIDGKFNEDFTSFHSNEWIAKREEEKANAKAN